MNPLVRSSMMFAIGRIAALVVSALLIATFFWWMGQTPWDFAIEILNEPPEWVDLYLRPLMAPLLIACLIFGFLGYRRRTDRMLLSIPDLADDRSSCVPDERDLAVVFASPPTTIQGSDEKAKQKRKRSYRRRVRAATGGNAVPVVISEFGNNKFLMSSKGPCVSSKQIKRFGRRVSAM